MEDNMDKKDQILPDSPSQRDLFFQEEEAEGSLTQPDTTPASPQAEVPSEKTDRQEEEPPAPAPQKKTRLLRHLQVSPQATPGQLLVQARELAAMELEEVAEITRIRFDYLKALEEDDKSRLPSSRVFVQSYIRTCMEVYLLDKESKERILERFAEEEKDLVEDVPEKVLEHIGKEGQVSAEEAQRVRMICIYGALAAILLLSLTITSIVAVSIRKSRAKETVKTEQNVRKFDSGKIEVLLAPQIPDPVILRQRGKNR